MAMRRQPLCAHSDVAALNPAALYVMVMCLGKDLCLARARDHKLGSLTAQRYLFSSLFFLFNNREAAKAPSPTPTAATVDRTIFHDIVIALSR